MQPKAGSAICVDEEQFPTLTFKSRNIRSTGGDDYEVIGDLTIRGVPKSVTLSVKDVSEPSKDLWENLRIGLSGSTKVNRKDFGLMWNAPLEFGGMLVGEEVTITLMCSSSRTRDEACFSTMDGMVQR